MTKEYSKRILLSVTGMSPAVVTETLYALVVEKNFIPTEIQVITTQQGKNKLSEALLGIVGGRQEKEGALSKFIKDYGEQYGFSDIHFDESCIHVIEKEGKKLHDIRTAEENTLASDQIVSLVGKLCQHNDLALHVSIAGGRKTMGFFIGYALSLYGRKQDSLSHVLVSEEFEKVNDFYYPTPYSYIINDSDGRELDARNAKVMLAEIPWVQLGLGIPVELKDQNVSYSESIIKAQALLKTPSLKFLTDMNTRKVAFGDAEVKLPPRAYAFLLTLSIANIQGWSFHLNENTDHIGKIYLAIYERIKADIRMRKTVTNVNKDIDCLETFKRVFSDARSDIKKKLKKALSLAKNTKTPYIPSSEDNIFRLLIEPENIDLTEIKEELKIHIKVNL